MTPRVRRKQKQTVLIYCEGPHDMMFMKHLKKLYVTGDQSVHFEIKPGSGGAPSSVVLGASKVLGDFDVRIAKFDNDKGVKALEAAYDMNADIRIAYCTPAIEATMLEILEPGKNYRTHNTQGCKRRLHGNYIAESDRMTPSKYDDLFSLDVLEAARTKHARLNRIIQIFEQGINWEGFSREDNAL